MDLLDWANPLSPVEDKIAAAHRFVASDTYFRRMFEQRQGTAGEDIASLLVTTGAGFENFLMIIRTFYAAGIDTTRDAITSTIYALLSSGLWSAAVADPSIIPNAAEETLRRDAPHRGLLRTAAVDVELDGVELPAGARLLLLYGRPTATSGTSPTRTRSSSTARASAASTGTSASGAACTPASGRTSRAPKRAWPLRSSAAGSRGSPSRPGSRPTTSAPSSSGGRPGWTSTRHADEAR